MKIILSLFFVLLHSVLSYAYNQFSFVKYQVENGLSHNTVWYTIQDHQGFMWFGTSDGLNRFDGKNFKIFRHIPKDSTSLGNNIVRTIFEDERQNLWVGTNRGIYIFNSQQEFPRMVRLSFLRMIFRSVALGGRKMGRFGYTSLYSRHSNFLALFAVRRKPQKSMG